MNEDKQVSFERCVFAVRCNASDLENLGRGVVVGQRELTDLSIAAARINAFILKHRKRAAA